MIIVQWFKTDLSFM